MKVGCVLLRGFTGVKKVKFLSTEMPEVLVIIVHFGHMSLGGSHKVPLKYKLALEKV